MGRKIRKKRTGGLLIGPSHEDGGILATTPGMPDVELEGGEYIINAQTVNALGTEFLDKLNSTQTTYHTGGFGAGQLPNPSNYRRGGVIRKKRRGGRIKRMPHGGPHNQNNMVTVAGQFINRRTGLPVPAGTFYHIHPEKGPMEGAVHDKTIPGGQAGHDFFDPANGGSPIMNTRNGRMSTRMSTGMSTGGGGYRRGGRIKRMPHGGPHNGSGRNRRNRNRARGMGRMTTTMRSSSGYKRGGNIRKMPHGGRHDGTQLFCPNGNYGYNEFGDRVCV